ncbi:MAG: WD40 repeat domain-containing protein [Ktedonobacteraceae bacterium]|nr:WD40 repeat domain-containing protein [Ktedonobacteraceae bacterium]
MHLRLHPTMQLHLHPTWQEALMADETTLTRWSLTTTPATRLAQHSTVPFSVFNERYTQDGRRAVLGGITRAFDDTLFAHQLLVYVNYSKQERDLSGLEIRSWEDISLTRTLTLPQTEGWIESLDASPDGRWLVLSPWLPERIYLLDQHSGNVMSHHAHLDGSITGLTFDPTSTYVAGCSSHDGGGALVLWHLDLAEHFVPHPTVHPSRLQGFPLDQINGSVALSLLHRNLDRTGIEWPENQDLVDTAATSLFSPDGHIVVFTLISAYSPSYLDLTAYEVPSGRRLWCLRSDVKASGQAIFTPDGRLLMLPEQGGDLLVYDVADGSLSQRLHPRLDTPVRALVFDHEERLWLATRDELVRYQP